MTTDSGQSTSSHFSTLPPMRVSESNNVEVLVGHENDDPYNSQPSLPATGVRQVTDSATQCCFDPRFSISVSVATQTEDFSTTNTPNMATNGSTASGVQQNDPVSAEQWKLSHDHNYSMPYPFVYPTYGFDDDKVAPLAPLPDFEVEDVPLSEIITEIDSDDWEINENDDDDEEKDPHWQPAEDEKILSPDEHELEGEKESEEETESPDTEKKYLVFNSSLDQLLTRCPKCGQVIIDKKRKTTGSMLSVELTCHDGHVTHWDSQPSIRRKPVGNLLLAASILFTGNTFARVSRLASCLNMQFISESVFYDTQKRFLFPVVNEAWENEQQLVRQELAVRDAVNLNGDGRCDSPGHNAKYGTYTLMDDDSGKVVAFSVVQVTETTSSNAMEKEGFKRCLESLEGDGVHINRIATDRHVSISSYMDKERPEINHQYDVWHLSKWVVKKLTSKAQQKGCEELSPWIQSISNHLWWCAATCGGNVQLLREKWKSVLNHIVNKHKWSGNSHFHKCEHGHIPPSEARQICWLQPGSPAHLALEEVVLNNKLLKDLAKLADFCHTGNIEVYHSMMLKYCSKQEHFSHKGMIARTQLAALDNNANTGREQALVQSGEHAGAERYKVCFPKAHKRWVVKPITQKKSFDHLSVLLTKVLERCEAGNAVADPPPVVLPRNIASVPAPPKEDLITNHRSRFNR